MNIKVDFDNIVVKEDKNDFNVKVLMLKGEKGDSGATKTSELINDSGFITNQVDNLANYYKKNETYTKTETNNLLDGKANNSALDNYYEISEVDELLSNKANNSTLDDYYTKTETYSQSEVDDLLDEKADTSTVQSQFNQINLALEDKANSSDVANTYETKESHNASIETLSSQISSLSNGSPLTASSISEMTDTSRIYVNTTDGKWYYYNGSSWVSGGVYQSSGISQNSINGSMIDTNNTIEDFNLVNWKDIREGGFYNGSTGEFTSGVSGSGLKYYTPNFIEVQPGATYRRKRCNANTIGYDENFNFLGNLTTGNLAPTTITIPSNVKYVRFSIGYVRPATSPESYDITKFEFSKNNQDDVFLPYKYDIEDLYDKGKAQLFYTINNLTGGVFVDWTNRKIIIKKCYNCSIVNNKNIIVLKSDDLNFGDYELVSFQSIYDANAYVGYIVYDRKLKQVKCITPTYYNYVKVIDYPNLSNDIIVLGMIYPASKTWEINNLGTSMSYRNDHCYYRCSNYKLNPIIKYNETTVSVFFPSGWIYFINKIGQYQRVEITNQTFILTTSTKLMYSFSNNEFYIATLSSSTTTDETDVCLLMNVDGHLCDGYLLPSLNSEILKQVTEYKSLTYEGEKISLQPSLDYHQEAFITYGQGGAEFNGKAFLFNGSGGFKVYDLENNAYIGDTYTLEKESGQTDGPHANCVCFGTEYYDEEDTYPLLYVNVYNNIVSRKGTCYVYRIQEGENTFTNTLVQIIKIGFTTEEPWINPSTPNNRWDWGNFLVDTDNNKLLVYTIRNTNVEATEGTMRIFKFDLPTLSDGASVTLSISDIIEYFDVPHEVIIQDGCYYNGMLFSSSGYDTEFPGLTGVHVIDLTKKEEISFIKTYPKLNGIEPETLFIYNNLLYYASTDFYTLKF